MFLKNKNIIFKIRRTKVTDYAALILAPSKFGDFKRVTYWRSLGLVVSEFNIIYS